MVTKLGMLSGKRVLVTKISQVEMPEEQKDLMGQICYPSRNFPIRLTEETPALNLPCAVPWDHRCFVTCSSSYGLDSSLSSEMVLNSSEVEHGMTH